MTTVRHVRRGRLLKGHYLRWLQRLLLRVWVALLLHAAASQPSSVHRLIVHALRRRATGRNQVPVLHLVSVRLI